ncbi:pseudouridylate synthase RPUSD2 isoform X2 [Stomoxys calcitrans]|uniref:pseudouridylate synthase RPUSD2 isoform X2 n=1 Tax=Stomoxys calcitrans TaxID=35570 RepID=UPI0027E31773|nr:pseudouridylate synthase RPUSD2 isoform X2 [Stomoxys calcitrans]
MSFLFLGSFIKYVTKTTVFGFKKYARRITFNSSDELDFLKRFCYEQTTLPVAHLAPVLRDIRSILHSLDLIQTFSILKMTSTVAMRHAQTQHGSYHNDEGNILCTYNVISVVHEDSQGSSPGVECAVTTTESPPIEQEQCVWFYEVDDQATIHEEKIFSGFDDYKDMKKPQNPEKRKVEDADQLKDLKKAKLETKALKAKRPGFTDERYHETSYYIENGLRKVYPYYFTFTTFTKGRWVGEKILDVFSREFRAHPAEEYERCINSGTLTVNYEKVPIDYKLKHNDLLANVVHRHEVPVTCEPITIVHIDDDIVVVNKPASIPVHPCGRYRHNTVVFILAKEYNLKNLRTIHRLDRLTSGLLLFGRSPKKARQLEHQIRNRQVQKEYVCRVEGNFPENPIECNEPIEVVSYKIGVCKVSPNGKECKTSFQKLSYDGKTSVVLCKPLTGRMHQIRVHLQYLGFPVANDPLYNHEVFGPLKGRGGDIGGKTDEELVRDLITIHNAENWLGIDNDSDISLFKPSKGDCDTETSNIGNALSYDETETLSEETSSLCTNSPSIGDIYQESATNCYLQTHNLPNVLCLDDLKKNDCSLPTGDTHIKVTVATQTDHESPDVAFNSEKMTIDKHCYECKVRYRDPKPEDLVMYLHAWKYKGPGWEYETKLPSWGLPDWKEKN